MEAQYCQQRDVFEQVIKELNQVSKCAVTHRQSDVKIVITGMLTHL